MSKKKKVLSLIQKGRASLDAAKFNEANTFAEAALRILPEFRGANDLLADVAFQQGDLTKVILVLNSLLKKLPDNYIYHTKIAVAYALQSDFQIAAVHLRKDFLIDSKKLESFSKLILTGLFLR